MSDEQQTMMKEGGAVLVPRYISACPVAGGSEDWTPAQWAAAATAAYLSPHLKNSAVWSWGEIHFLWCFIFTEKGSVSESRDVRCPPWTQNSEYLWLEILFVKLCESADLLGGGSSMVQVSKSFFASLFFETQVFKCDANENLPSVTTSSSCCWSVTQA